MAGTINKVLQKFNMINKKQLEKKLKKRLIYMSIILNFFLLFGIMNLLAISDNGGRMPVKDLGYETDRHFSFEENSEVKYWFFSDIIYIGNYIASIGDIGMVIGVILSGIFCFLNMKDYIKHKIAK